jgi:hypothetical protein
MPTYDTIKQDASIVASRFANDWGAVRRFLSAHPLTGAEAGVGAGLDRIAVWLF